MRFAESLTYNPLLPEEGSRPAWAGQGVVGAANTGNPL